MSSNGKEQEGTETMEIGKIEAHTGRFFGGLQDIDPSKKMSAIWCLSVSNHSPRAEIRRRKDDRKRRRDADDSSFDPASHRAIIWFAPTEASDAPSTGTWPRLKIADVERHLARLFGCLPEMELPDALHGLGCLAVEGRCPHVEIRHAKLQGNKMVPGKKQRGDAKASSFNPDNHLIVVDFGKDHGRASAPSSGTRSKMERQLQERFGAEAPRRRGRFTPIRTRGANVSDAVIEDRR